VAPCATDEGALANDVIWYDMIWYDSYVFSSYTFDAVRYSTVGDLRWKPANKLPV